MVIFSFNMQITSKHTLILFYKLNYRSSNKKFTIFTCPEATWRPAAPEPEGQIQFFLNIRKIHPKSKFFSFITYPLNPKTKPMLPVYAKVSDPT